MCRATGAKYHRATAPTGSASNASARRLSVGHDEYWSETTRDRAEASVARGGNAAFFGANLCWWRIPVVDGGTAIVCHQGGPKGALDHWRPHTGAARPEDALAGVSYRHGDSWQERPPREMPKAGEGIHAAAMGIFTCNGTVFTAGTTDWAQVLGRDARVDRITRNVIDGLLQSHSTKLANR